MKAPRPSFTPSRHNVGAYGVRVCWQDYKIDAPRWTFKAKKAEAYRRLGLEPHSYRATQSANIAPDGSLSIEPERWAVRHYRRAVMRGAGVYQAGLWAFLAGQRVKSQSGAALVGNDAGTLARFGSAIKPPPQHVTQVIDMTPRAGEVTGRQRERAHGKAAANNSFFELVKSVTASALQAVTQAQAQHKQFLKEVTEGIEQAAKQAKEQVSVSEAVRAELSQSVKAHLKAALAERLASLPPRSESLAALYEAGKGALAEQRASLGSDAERFIFDEVERQLLRILRRLLPPFRRPQHPASIPRPLHARPRPPAAPLAPPAL